MTFLIKLVLNITIVVASIAILVVGLVFISSNNKNTKDCSFAEAPTGYGVTHTGVYTSIQWQSPEQNQGCNVTYVLRYTINELNPVEVDTLNSYYSMPRLDPCSTISGEIWALSEGGNRSIETLPYEHNYIPSASDVPTPTNLDVSGVTEGFEITWSTPAGLSLCTVSFHIAYVADRSFGNYDTDQESYIISHDDFCLSCIVTVATVVNDVTGSSLLKTYEDNEVLTGLTYYISPGLFGDQVIASWIGHSKEADCNIEYVATYNIEDVVQETVRTSEPTAAFNITYCVNGSVSVRATALLGVTTTDTVTILVPDCDEE